MHISLADSEICSSVFGIKRMDLHCGTLGRGRKRTAIIAFSYTYGRRKSGEKRAQIVVLFPVFEAAP
jgi:hypothetical protein